jgi:hypothetical protein
MDNMSVESKTHDSPWHFFMPQSFGKPGNRSAATPRTKDLVTIGDLNGLPKPSQLLLAHFLKRNKVTLTLLDCDRDADSLISHGWLTSLPATAIGIKEFKFKRQFWHQLKSLSPMFLTPQLLHELGFYRVRKTGMYPWVW